MAKIIKKAADIAMQQLRRRFAQNDTRIRFQLRDADVVLRRGLVWAMGEDARWLPEYAEVADWLSNNQGKGLLCMGDCGRGKTQITRDILPRIFNCYLRLAYNYCTAKQLKDEFDKMSRYKIICIDDIGTEAKVKSYGNTRDYIEDLVDQCEQDHKLLICSTNLTADELLQRYDLRVFDRLKALCRRVVFEGDSMRDETNHKQYETILTHQKD